MTEARKCFAIIEGQFHPDHGYVPSLVTEDEPGHVPMMGNGDESEPWYWGATVEQARAVCAEANLKDFGLTPADTKAIIDSSVAASIRVDAARESAHANYNRKLGRNADGVPFRARQS